MRGRGTAAPIAQLLSVSAKGGFIHEHKVFTKALLLLRKTVPIAQINASAQKEKKGG